MAKKRADGWPRGPVAPKMPTVRAIEQPQWPTMAERRQAQVEDIAKSERLAVWQNTHPLGGQYDFIIFDFLQYEKHLSETDFQWQAQIAGLPVDFYFPSRQHAWSLSSRQGFAVRQILFPLPLTKEAARSTGVSHITVFIEDLASNPKAALEDAWNGVQRGGTD